MDGAANDGRPGESDNVINVEKIESHVSGTLAGGDGDDDFRVFANIDEGNSTMAGNGGNDKLIAGDYTDTLDGGPGNDVLNGGYGNDTITGGPGQDTIQGDANSTHLRLLVLHVQDPVRQRRRSTPVTARSTTSTAASAPIRRSSTRSTSSPTARRSTAPRPATADDPSGPGAAAEVLVRRPSARRSCTVTVPCAGACKVSATLTVKGKKLATGRKTLLKAGNAKLTLKFAKPRRNVTATLKVTVESADGKTSASKKVKLKR